MNLSIFWRLVWKEYRLQRSLWIAMTVLTVMLQLLIVVYRPPHVDRATMLYLIAVAFPALYALGCGATLFAGEREADTYEFQRSLPVGAWAVFVGKIVLALASAAVMFGLMVWLATYLSGPELPGAPNPSILRATAWATFGFFGLEMFLWAVLFSLLSRRVLLAAVLGVTAASIGAHIAAATVTLQVMMETYWQALPMREAIAALVALVDVGLAARWFREKRQKAWRPMPSAIADAPRQASAFSDRLHRPQRLAILGRLVWQHWRQSRRTSLAILALFIPLIAILIMWLLRAHNYQTWFLERHAGEIYQHGDRFLFCAAFLMALASVTLLGVCAFLADQRRNSYRFLTDRGIAPKFVWLSRQLVTLGLPLIVLVSLLLGLFFLASALLPSPLPSHLLPWASLSDVYAEAYAVIYLVFAILGYVVLGIAVGQFCSMFFRSALLAGLFSILLTGVLVVWCALMFFWQVNWLWSILPIPLALLLVTQLRTSDWLLERNSPRTWLRPGLALLVPAAALLIAVPLYRIYSVPLIDPGFSPEEFAQPMTPEEQATLILYAQASRIVTPPPYNPGVIQRQLGADALTEREITWVDDNSATIAMLLKASRRKIDNPLSGQSIPLTHDLSDLANLLVCGAARSEDKGKLDAALEQYLAALRLASYLRDWYAIPVTEYDRHYNANGGDRANLVESNVYARLPLWAAQKDQTPERILAAARQLEQITSDVALSNGVKHAYLQLRRFLSCDFDAIFPPGHQEPTPWPTLFWSHLPWEHARAERMLNCLTRRQLTDLSWAEEGVRKGKPLSQLHCAPNATARLTHRYMGLPYALNTTIWVPPVQYDSNWAEVKLVQDYAAAITARRAVRVVLALEAWKLKHGSLPKTLDELVGPYLDHLPLDPYSGKPFHYFRNGLKIPLDWHQPGTVAAFGNNHGTIDADVPFIWASGAKLRRTEDSYTTVKDDVLHEYQIFTYIVSPSSPIDEWRWPTCEFDVWEAGWPFPIP